MRTALLFCLLIWVSPSPAIAQWDPADVVPAEQRQRFRNPDGSCVQCSMCMSGVDHDVPAAEFLLEGHPEYGPPVRGGSWPSRVREYCQERGIEAWHVEGDTMPWIDWALRTGRPVVCTLNRAHMQWLAGASADLQTLYVVDNNSPQQVDEWTRARFIQQHTIHDGGWCVIFKGPRPTPWVAPEFVQWWNQQRSVAGQSQSVAPVAHLFGRK